MARVVYGSGSGIKQPHGGIGHCARVDLTSWLRVNKDTRITRTRFSFVKGFTLEKGLTYENGTYRLRFCYHGLCIRGLRKLVSGIKVLLT